MKKYLVLLAAAALAFVGCSKEVATGDATYSFEVSADQVATKAVIDNDGAGVNVNRFVMEVYLVKNGNLQIFDRQVKAPTATSPAKTTFTLTLVKDQEYKVLFWADKANADLSDLYYDTADLRQVKVAGVNFTINDDKLDAFSKAETITKDESTQGFTKSIKLTRPFAQLNFITKDIKQLVENAERSGNWEFIPTNVKLEYYAFHQFDVLNQKASEPALVSKTAPVYSTAGVATKPEQFTLGMSYLMTMTGEAEVRDLVKMTVLAGTYELTTLEVPNVPFQRNYRTNIIGNLITSTDQFVVEIDPVWNTPENQISYVAPGIADHGNNQWVIESELGFQNLGLAFSSLSVNYPNTLTINATLGRNLDFAGLNWVVNDLKGQSYVSLVLDGDGKTISNLVLSGEYDRLGMFNNIGCVGDQYGGHMTIKNLTVKDCSFTSTKAGSYVGVFGANASSIYYQDVTIDGCTVKSTKYVGGLVAYDAHGSSTPQIVGVTVKNCVLSAVAESGSTSAGAYYGYTQCPHYLKDCASTDNTITGVYAGAYYGNLNATGTFNNCTVNGVVATTQAEVDGRPNLGSAVFE